MNSSWLKVLLLWNSLPSISTVSHTNNQCKYWYWYYKVKNNGDHRIWCRISMSNLMSNRAPPQKKEIKYLIAIFTNNTLMFNCLPSSTYLSTYVRTYGYFWKTFLHCHSHLDLQQIPDKTWLNYRVSIACSGKFLLHLLDHSGLLWGEL